MKAKLVSGVKKAAAIAAGAMFLGATMGAATVFGTTLNQLPGPFVSSGAVHAVVVVGAAAASQDVLGSVDLAAALAANAASTHVGSSTGGSVWLGNLVHQGGSQTSMDLTTNGTAWTNAPLSVNVANKNFTTTAKNNFTADMNLTFTSTKPYFNEMNAVLPAGSWELQSYVVNRSGGSRNPLGSVTNGMEYLLGDPATMYNLTAHNSVNISFAASSSTPNVNHATSNATWFKVPKTLNVGSSTVVVDGVATVYTGSGSYNQVQITVNSGTATYYNLSTTHTVDGVTFTLGPTYVNNGSAYLSSITASSYSLTQNISAGHNAALSNFGLTSFNVTDAALGAIDFTPTFAKTLAGSLSSSSSFMAGGLVNVTLDKLTHAAGAAGDNLTVVTGASGTDVLVPFNYTSGTAKFNLTTGLKNVVFGTDFRGPMQNYNWTNGADNLLEPMQWNYSVSKGNITAASEYVFPKPSTGTTYASITQKSGWSNFTFAGNSSHGGSSTYVQPLIYLPNGRAIGLILRPKTGSAPATHSYNVTGIVNYTSLGHLAGIITPVIGTTYSFGGYNLTVGKTDLLNNSKSVLNVTNLTLKGPVSTFNDGVAYSIVPGYNGMYASNGTKYSTVNLPKGLGTASFSNNKLTVTDPIGGTVNVPTAENTSSFATYFPTNVTAAADTWGTYLLTSGVVKINGTSRWGNGTYDVNVPSQNYTLTVGGSETVSGATKYNLTSGTVLNGEFINASGVSSSFSASSLFGTNVFPLGSLDSSFVGATNNVPVVVVGGPAVNTLALKLYDTTYNVTGYGGGTQFTNLTHVRANESLVWMFNNVSAFGHEPALWVAGWAGQDTLLASEVVSESLLGTPVSGVTLNGSKVVLSSGSGTLSSVRVVSSS